VERDEGLSSASLHPWKPACAWLFPHAEQTPSTTEPNSAVKLYYAALVLVLLAVLLPIWMVKYPGMVDYPNHLVRCYIFAHYHDNPLWQQRYFLDLSPLPNLAIDLVVTPLVRLMPLMVCGKLFLSFAAVLYVVGCSEVGRAATGRLNGLALVCAFTFYNLPLFQGFVNYIFGLGVFLCAFAYWLQVRNRMTPLRFVLCCLLSLAAFLAHLAAIAILGAACFAIAFVEFLRDRKLPRFIAKVAWLVCPLLLVTGYFKSSGHAGTIVWPSLAKKLPALFMPLSSYNLRLNVVIGAVLLLCAVAILRRSRIHLAATASLVLLALFFITPGDLFTGAHVDERYVVPAWLLLALSLETHWGRWQKAALAVALAAMLVRTGGITADWLKISRHDEQVLAMGDGLPRGASIYVLQPDAAATAKLDRGYFHIIQFWTLSHKAVLSSLFALPGQQPLVSRQPRCEGPAWAECFAGYDFVWTYDPPPAIRQVLLGMATPAAAWEKVTLWRVTSGKTRAAE